MRNENETLFRVFFRNKIIVAILVIDIICIFVAAFAFSRQAARTATVVFNIAPIDATISVNGDSHYTNSQYSIAPGKYDIKISHDGLESKNLSIDIKSNHFVSVATFLAGADNNFDYYEANNHYESFNKLKSIASADNNSTIDNDTSAQDFIASFGRKVSILDTLPVSDYIYAEPSVGSPTSGFTIRDGRDEDQCEKSTCLLVEYFGKDHEKAVKNKLRELGYSTEDYRIIYRKSY